MAKAGKTAAEILAFYYPGTTLIGDYGKATVAENATVETGVDEVDEVTNKAEAIRAWANAHIGCPYIFGATMKTCTPSYRRARQEQYPAYASKIKAYCPVLKGSQRTCAGCKYNGKPAFDCAQLTRWAANSVGIYLPSGATNQWTGDYWAMKGLISGMPRDAVCMVYKASDTYANKKTHTGIYTGDGNVIEARGHASGVIKDTLESYPWTHYAILRGLDGDIVIPPIEPVMPILRNGSKGEYVTVLQNLLNQNGASLKVDGIFGDKTDAAVRKYQKGNQLKVDGIVGKLTWGELLEDVPDDEPEEEPILLFTAAIPIITDSVAALVKVSDLTAWQADEVVAKYPGTTVTQQN
jgi:cell wall-associated NlpC family hydrolase